MKQEMMVWQWHQLNHMQIIYTSLQTDNYASTSSHNFLQAGCTSWQPAECQSTEGNVLTIPAQLKMCMKY